MAKKQAIEGKGKKPRQTSWNDMDADILLKIFASLSVLDLVIRISGVCKSWRSLLQEPILWKTTLDLSMFRNYFLSQNLDRANERGLYFFKIAMNRSSLQPKKLIFDITPTINDKFLIYVAERCPNLKELVVPSTQYIREGAIAKAFEFWGSLESLFISFYSCLPSNTIFENIGAKCKNLTVLKIRSCMFGKETAATISKWMPGLKVFRIRCAEITKDTAEILVDTMVNLEELYLSISGIGHESPSTQHRFLPPLQDESMKLKVTRLRMFHFCVGYCQPCIAVTEGYSSLGDFYFFYVNL
ncbi:hypothetical protein ACH5RR_001464 [Cinchona calisaya]|uniref:F-box domain-containing protein n=1 Tax=Cinchona calisaya TaxID=153742 RepID=A0ABD3B490_9GENT